MRLMELYMDMMMLKGVQVLGFGSSHPQGRFHICRVRELLDWGISEFVFGHQIFHLGLQAFWGDRIFFNKSFLDFDFNSKIL